MSPPSSAPSGAAIETRKFHSPQGFKRIAQLEEGRRVDFFNLGGRVAVVLYPFDETAMGEAKLIWVEGEQATNDASTLAGLGPMGWVELDTRGRPYPIRSPLPNPSEKHLGERRITSMATAADGRLLVIVTWSGRSGSHESTSIVFGRTTTNPQWKKLDDAGDTQVVGLHHVGVVPVDGGAVVAERALGLGKPGFPVTYHVRALGTQASPPPLTLTLGSQACPGAIDGIALISHSIVAWGISCASGQGKYLLEWYKPGDKQSKKLEVKDAPQYPSGVVTPLHDALLVRPEGNAGYRLALKQGNWERLPVPVTAIETVRGAFEQAALSMSNAFDTHEGDLLVLARCSPSPSDTGSGPVQCLYRSTATAPPANTAIPGERSSPPSDLGALVLKDI